MTDGFSFSLMWRNPSKLLLALSLGGVLGMPATTSNAQGTDGVTVNLSVLDDLDPMKTLPRLMMPSSQPSRGRVILTPPAGVSAISPQRSRITLRPPAGTPSRIAATPRLSVPKPAAAALAPPTSVTAPPPAPAPEPASPTVEESVDVVAPEPSQVATAPTPSAAPMGPVESSALPVEPEPEPASEVASLPAAEETERPTSIRFGEDETELPSTANGALTELADKMKSDESLRVQLLAYASSADGSASSVRRKSLSRALSVREFLMDEGVQSTRIEVRALGDQSEGGNPNRVDAVIDQR